MIMTEPREDESAQEPTKHSWTRSSIRIKELLGLPTYCAGILALMKATNNGNTLLVIVGAMPFVIAYYYFYDYLFPNHQLNGQWVKVVLLVGGQIVFWALIWKFVM